MKRLCLLALLLLAVAFAVWKYQSLSALHLDGLVDYSKTELRYGLPGDGNSFTVRPDSQGRVRLPFRYFHQKAWLLTIWDDDQLIWEGFDSGSSDSVIHLKSH